MFNNFEFKSSFKFKYKFSFSIYFQLLYLRDKGELKAFGDAGGGEIWGGGGGGVFPLLVLK